MAETINCIFPLAARLPRGVVHDGDPISPNDSQEARVMRLTGYGNAINIDVAVTFIQSIMELINE